MKAILQYEITNAKIGEMQSLRIPINSQILSAEPIGSSIFIDALVPDNFAGDVTRHFILYAPGKELPVSEGTYIATIIFSKTTLYLYELAGSNILMKDDTISQLLKDDNSSNLRKDLFL